ncbi:MAG: hypothetical protein ISS29_04375 [Candidatus Marinimicrobia bacterium]|nr:hypothetical protein [Candidatus Neomarinimicrobiota bacterium]
MERLIGILKERIILLFYRRAARQLPGLVQQSHGSNAVSCSTNKDFEDFLTMNRKAKNKHSDKRTSCSHR